MKEHVNQHVASRSRSTANILKVAATVFARRGFDGATTGEISQQAGIAKATIHYYFETKEGLYTSVLEQVLSSWGDAMEQIDLESGPLVALGRYISWKIGYSHSDPDLTRVWAMEVLAGAPHTQPFLHNRVKQLVEEKGEVIKAWIADGKMDPIDPAHLFFMLWATTQTYAECQSQIEVVLGRPSLDEEVFDIANETVTRVLLKGLGVKA